jgi:hypothetical protein
MMTSNDHTPGQRYEFEMSEQQLAAILDACRPVPMIMLQCGAPSSPQENANRAWAALGYELGFDSMSVEPVSNKGDRFFTAIAKAAGAAS